MEYPKINKKSLTKAGKIEFNEINKLIKSSLSFDNKENELGLTKKDIDLLSYNIAVHLFTFDIRLMK